jgi:CheY-like chemotaxis protein
MPALTGSTNPVFQLATSQGLPLVVMNRRPLFRHCGRRRSIAGGDMEYAADSGVVDGADTVADGELRCVIVDDSPVFRTSATRLLERQGITVAGVAGTCREALRGVRELRPDIVLVDIQLGGESGFDLVRCLHDATASQAVWSILISNTAEQDYSDLIAASPAVGFLAKAALSAGAIRDLLANRATGR